jgi:hypothetical protein
MSDRRSLAIDDVEIQDDGDCYVIAQIGPQPLQMPGRR